MTRLTRISAKVALNNTEICTAPQLRFTARGIFDSQLTLRFYVVHNPGAIMGPGLVNPGQPDNVPVDLS